MSLTYGKYNDKGFGFHGGVQWMFENMDINDYLGLPLSVSWSSGRRTFKQTLEVACVATLFFMLCDMISSTTNRVTDKNDWQI